MQQLKDYISSIQFDCKRGRYDARQVDEFIASVLEQVNTLEQQINALKEENARYESQSASMAAAMITAEKNCAEMLEQAKAQADEIREAAKKEGEDFVKSMYDRQSDMENEYRAQKEKLISEVASIKRFKDKYHHAVERDVIEVLSKISGMDSNKVWKELPEEVRREYGLDDTYEGLDINEILKDLPENDHELKEMIEDLL